MDTVGEGESGTSGGSSISLYTLSGVRGAAGEKFLCAIGHPGWHRDDLGEWKAPGSRGCMYNYG